MLLTYQDLQHIQKLQHNDRQKRKVIRSKAHNLVIFLHLLNTMNYIFLRYYQANLLENIKRWELTSAIESLLSVLLCVINPTYNHNPLLLTVKSLMIETTTFSLVPCQLTKNLLIMISNLLLLKSKLHLRQVVLLLLTTSLLEEK